MAPDKTIVVDSDDAYDGISLSDYEDGEIMLIQNGEAVLIRDEDINAVIEALAEVQRRRRII